jgi:hypothetical protein
VKQCLRDLIGENPRHSTYVRPSVSNVNRLEVPSVGARVDLNLEAYFVVFEFPVNRVSEKLWTYMNGNSKKLIVAIREHDTLLLIPCATEEEAAFVKLKVG